MVPRTRDETAAAVAIVTHVVRGADRLEDAVQEVDPQGEIEMTEDDPVVDRCLDGTIVTTLSGGQDRHEGVAHSDQNAAKDRVLPSGDGRGLTPARGVIQSLESVPNLARGPERGNDLALHAEGQEALTEGSSELDPSLGRVV